MNLTEKIGAGLKVAACTSFAATYIGCAVELNRANEYAGLEKEIEVPQHGYRPAPIRITGLEKERHAHNSNAMDFMIYGSSSTLGLLALNILLQEASPLFKRREELQSTENEEQAVKSGELKTK